jgi:hypothetical protein
MQVAGTPREDIDRVGAEVFETAWPRVPDASGVRGVKNNLRDESGYRRELGL